MRRHSGRQLVRMDAAAQALEFEKAARYRNTIARVRRVQSEQVMESDSADLDAIAAFKQSGGVCVAVLSVRGGRVLGVIVSSLTLVCLNPPKKFLMPLSPSTIYPPDARYQAS